jgi:O-antigen/teichoic acid export membrane protein
MSNRKKRALNGVLAGSFGSFLIQLVNIAVTPTYLNLTSQELYGVWLTLAALLGWIKIGDMGLGMALTRRSVKAWEDNDYSQLSRLAYGAMLSTFIFSIFVASIAFFATDQILIFFNVTTIFEDEFRNTFTLLLIVAVLRPSMGVFSSLIDSKQHIAYIGIRNTVLSLVVIGVTIILLYTNVGIISFAYALLIEAFLIVIVDIIYLKNIDKNLTFFPIRTSKKDIYNLLNFGGPFQIIKLTNLVSTNIDNILIASFIGFFAVPVYVFTGKLAFSFAIFVIGLVPSMLFPGITQLFETNNLNKIRGVYLKLSNIAIRVGILTSLVYFAVNESFVKAWVGDENFGGLDLTIIFVFWILLESYVRGITVIIYSSGKIKQLATIASIESIINIILTIFFIKYFDIKGAVLASVICRLISVFYLPFSINKILNINSYSYLKNIIKETIIYSIPLVILVIIFFVFIFYTGTVLSLFDVIFISVCILFVNIFSYEGMYLLRLKGMPIRQRFNKLIKNYLSV